MIQKPFTAQSLREVLQWGLTPDSAPHTHREIAEWCFRFCQVHEEEFERSGAWASALRVADDVDAQWELFLVNTYSNAELQRLDFSAVRLPVEWFAAWLSRLER
ncbi:hypothetical protein NR798_41280 [Archangium gephyra]|uniref:hypothetical protein n=1 Tax=Archangium gephyra TaxID=48 RepID=UPI0035D4264A